VKDRKRASARGGVITRQKASTMVEERKEKREERWMG